MPNNPTPPSKSTHNHRRLLPQPPPPPLYIPFGHVLPPNSGYYNPTPPPLGYMPPLPPHYPQSSPALPMPYWDENTYIYTQTPPPFSSFPPPSPPPPSPFWDNNQAMHPPCSIPQSLKDSILRRMILIQIEHYFCDDNLARDVHLKENMDNNGWLPITVIARFDRVRKLTNDIPLILDSLKDSKRVEVEAHKVRRRDNWKKWIGYKINMVTSEEVSSKDVVNA